MIAPMSETERAVQGDLAARPVDPRTDEAIAGVEEQFDHARVLARPVKAAQRLQSYSLLVP